ncbi:MAG: hypothetical protein HY652_01885 [Acidobacteria bacterium]|nr:hypothetical protein [Acidobacteriota bacterium]
MKERNLASVTFRLPLQRKKQLEKISELEHRSLAQQVQTFVEEGLIRYEKQSRRAGEEE